MVVAKRPLLGSALSLSVMTVGCGVLAIPATFETDGVTLVALTLLLVGVLTVVSIDFLVVCINKVGAHSYEEISDELLGPVFKQIIRWVLILYNVATAAGYLLAIGEIFTPMLPLVTPFAPFLSSSAHVILVLWVFVMLPLSFIPKVSDLHFTSFLAIAATFFISGIICLRYFLPVTPESRNLAAGVPAPLQYFKLSPRALLSLPVIMFSFDCQSLVFQVHSSLGCPSRRDMVKVSCTSVLVTSLIYGTVGFFGYAANTPSVHGNILTNYDPLRDHLFAVGQTFYSVTVMLAYVLILIPARDSLLQMIYSFNHASASTDAGGVPLLVNCAVTLLLAVVCLVVALLSPGFLFIVAVMGAFCSSTLCFTYPALFRHRLHSMGIARCSAVEKLAVCCMYAFGVGGFLLGFYVLYSAAIK